MLMKRIHFTKLDVALLVLLAGGVVWVFSHGAGGFTYKWDWSVISTYMVKQDADGGWAPNALLEGLLATIRLSIWATVLAALFGGVMGLCRISTRLLPRLLGGAYVEFVRNMPPLVLIFIVYFFLSDQIMLALDVDDTVRALPDGVKSVINVVCCPPERFTSFLSALLTLALYEGAYITEIVRAGIQSIDRGQWEAAHALGLTPWQRMRRVILPQAMPRLLPPLAGQFISTIKDSAIVAVISVQELTFQGLELMAATFQTFEIWITIGGMYLVLCLACSLGAQKLEKRLRRGLA